MLNDILRPVSIRGNSASRGITPFMEARGHLFSKILKLVFKGLLGSFGCAGYLFRGEDSMRFHPKRRASTDHKPGPNIARAAQEVATRR